MGIVLNGHSAWRVYWQMVGGERGAADSPAHTYTMPGERGAGRRSFALGETATPAGESPSRYIRCEAWFGLAAPPSAAHLVFGQNCKLGLLIYIVLDSH